MMIAHCPIKALFTLTISNVDNNIQHPPPPQTQARKLKLKFGMNYFQCGIIIFNTPSPPPPFQTQARRWKLEFGM
jgi:hypothetical protein